jgi:cell division protein FtsN
MMKRKIFSLVLLVFLIASCTSTQQSIENPVPEVYVFDNVERIDSSLNNKIPARDSIVTVTIPIQEKITSQKFIVQVGAFSTKERAERFVSENKLKVEYEMNISHNSTTNLYVVQFPPFENRENAENVRNKIWKISSFSDAFIITIEE